MGVQKKTRKFARVKRIIGQRDARLKTNQVKDELQGKRRGKDDALTREMYAENRLTYRVANCLQSASVFVSFFPVQYRSCSSVLRSHRHQLPLAHCPEEARVAPNHDGLSLCQMRAHDHRLRHGRTRKTWSEIPYCSQDCAR